MQRVAYRKKLEEVRLERERKEREERERLERERLAREKAQRESEERERQASIERERQQSLEREKEQLARKQSLVKSDSSSSPVEDDDWSDGDHEEDQGPVSPSSLHSLTQAASKVSDAETAAREAKQAAESALELNRELSVQNEQLRTTLSSNVAEYADRELVRENERLKQQVLQLQSKLMRSQEVSLISAKVVDSRITYREGRQFVEYKLQIETNTRGTLYVWHRYSTFRNLAATLQTKNGYRRKDIPELPNKQLFGNFSEKIIQERVVKLNQFLEAATKAEYLQWGIRVDQDTCVYKRRVKTPPPTRDSTSTNASTTNSSPRQSSRLSMKSFSFRRSMAQK
jgi:myosin-5